jgi:hypothetical protein
LNERVFTIGYETAGQPDLIAALGAFAMLLAYALVLT